LLLTVVYLETHLIHPVLPGVEKGKIAIVELVKVVVLRCPNAVVFKAIATSATFQPYLQFNAKLRRATCGATANSKPSNRN
jgi:hypothetical protein